MAWGYLLTSFFPLRTNAPPEGHLTFTLPRLFFFISPLSKAGHLIRPQGLRADSVVFLKATKSDIKEGKLRYVCVFYVCYLYLNSFAECQVMQELLLCGFDVFFGRWVITNPPPKYRLLRRTFG